VDVRERRDLYNGFGSGLQRAFELAVTPAVFGGLGYLVDQWLDCRPIFTIAALVVALVAMFIRFWYAYDGEMKAHEARSPWARRGPAQ
jgi:F0F1-type ATP synthase assembly protein I